MLFGHFWTAWAGRNEWKKILRQYDIKNRQIYVLLMPETDKELNRQALLHLNDFIENRLAEGVVILAADEQAVENAAMYSDKIICVKKYPDKKIICLLKYYTLYKFSEKLIIVSLSRPEGNNGYKTIGKHGVTVEDMVCLGLYNLRHVPQKQS